MNSLDLSEFTYGHSVSRNFMKIKGIHFLTKLNYSQRQDAVLAKTGDSRCMFFVLFDPVTRKFATGTVLFFLEFLNACNFFNSSLCTTKGCSATVRTYCICDVGHWSCHECYAEHRVGLVMNTEAVYLGEITFPFRCTGMGVASVRNFFSTTAQRSGVFAKWLGVMCRYWLIPYLWIYL